MPKVKMQTNMSLKENLDVYCGHLMMHVDKILVEKDTEVHGEKAVTVTAFYRKGMYNYELDANYLTRLKMTNQEMAYDFSRKLDKALRGVIEE